MPATVTDRFPWEFQGGNNPTWTLRYTVHDAADEAAAKTALAATAPATYDSLVRDAYSAEDQGGGTFLAEVRYVSAGNVKKQIPVGEERESGSTGGGTQHINQSKETKMAYGGAYTAVDPDFEGAICVSSDTVEGCEVVTPAYAFAITKAMSAGTVASSKATWYALTGKVNSDTWKGFSAGEVLFLGADWSQRDDGNFDVTFRFEAKPNKTNQTIGTITGIAYNGWDYVWIRYVHVEDDDAKVITMRPGTVYVERVYDTGAFSGLGLAA